MSQNNSRVVFFFSGAIFVAPWLWFQICGGGAGMNKNTNFSILLELKFFPEKVVGINDIWKQIKKFILICTTTLWTLVCPLVPRRLILFTFIKKVTWATAEAYQSWVISFSPYRRKICHYITATFSIFEAPVPIRHRRTPLSTLQKHENKSIDRSVTWME